VPVLCVDAAFDLFMFKLTVLIIHVLVDDDASQCLPALKCTVNT